MKSKIGSVTMVTSTINVFNMATSEKMMWFLLFDELCDDTVENFVIGTLNRGT